jgi:type IV pilus assembly protein PilF
LFKVEQSMWKAVNVIVLMSILCGCMSIQTGNSNTVPDPLAAAKNRLTLGLTYLQSNNFQQAKFNIDKALDFAPRYAEAHYGLAYYYQKVDENKLADESYLVAINLDPNNAEIANSYGAFLCTQTRYSEAQAYFNLAINNPSYLSTSQSYENLAICSQSQGDITAAIDYLNRALNFEPTRQTSLYLLAELYASKNQHEKALATITTYERILGPNPDSMFLSFEIELSQGDQRKAQQILDTLASGYPEHPNTILAKQQLAAFVKHMVKQRSSAVSSIVPDDLDNASLNHQETNATPSIHTLAKGETLYRLSRVYNVSVSDIMSWNNIKQTDTLSIGIKLIVGYN